MNWKKGILVGGLMGTCGFGIVALGYWLGGGNFHRGPELLGAYISAVILGVGMSVIGASIGLGSELE
mgnify:CR=1 FL=1